MRTRVAPTSLATVFAIFGLALSSGCATYSGGGRPITAADVKAEDGWIVAAATPTVRQRDHADCAAAALSMLAQRWHVRHGQHAEVAAALPPPTDGGVRLGDVRDAARALGLVAFAVVGDQGVLAHELEAGRPVIVGLLRPYSRGRALSHFEVVIALRRSDDKVVEVVTIDPGSGWLLRPWSDFEAEWTPAANSTLVVIGGPN